MPVISVPDLPLFQIFPCFQIFPDSAQVADRTADGIFHVLLMSQPGVTMLADLDRHRLHPHNGFGFRVRQGAAPRGAVADSDTAEDAENRIAR